MYHLHRLGLCCVLVLFIAAPAAAGDLLAGFATVDITPPLGREMAGFGPYLERKATSVHDPLMAHAAVIEVDGKRVAVVGCDLAGVTLDLTQQVRTLVEAGTGIPGRNVLISASHTHSGPAVPHWVGWGARDEEYLQTLPQKIAQAVITASARLQPVKVYYAEVPVEGVGENREYPNGPVDKYLRVLEFKHGETVTGFIVHHSVHNVIFSELMHTYSADLTGVGIAKVGKDYPGAVGIYLQGFCGDINPKPSNEINYASPEKCQQLLDHLSDLFAGYVRQALKSATLMDVKQLEMDTRPLSLPEVPTDRALVLRQMQLANELLGDPAKPSALPLDVQRWLRYSGDSSRAVFERFKRSPRDARETEIQALRLQDVLILTAPAEVFITFANQLAYMLPNWKVWAAGYANDYVGYIPSADRYDVASEKFSYAAYFTPGMNGEFRFREDVGDVLVREMVRLAHEMNVE